MRSRWIDHWIATFMLVVALVLTGCGNSEKSDKSDSPAAAPVIRLAAIFPMTGNPVAAGMTPAFTLAVQEANDAGGVLGRRVEIVTADDACDSETAVRKANEMIAMDIAVSVGGLCSQAVAPTLKIFHDAGIPMVIPAANSTDLTAPGYDSVFLLSGTTAIEAQQAVAAMPRLNAHRLVVVHDSTSYAETMARAAVEAAQKDGSQVTLAGDVPLIQGADRYDHVATQILAADGDIVFYAGYETEAGKLIRDLRAAGYRGKIMVGDGGVSSEVFRYVSTSAIEGVYGVAQPMPQFQPGLGNWMAKYRAIARQDPGNYSMHAYDAVRLALNAIQRAGTLDRAAVRDALANTRPDDVALLSGSASFNPDGTQRNEQFLLLRVHDGAFMLDSRMNR